MLTHSPKRLLYCSLVAPQRTGAGELLVHRHLSRLSTWETLVVTPPHCPADAGFERRLAVPLTLPGRVLLRGRRRPWWRLADSAAARTVIAQFAAAADAFQPDIVVSTMLPDVYLSAAAAYARRAGLPLALFCHDDYETLTTPEGRSDLARMYRQAAVRFCVSRVMEREFAARYGAPGVALYPIPEREAGTLRAQTSDAPLIIGYAGSVAEGYEAVMLALANALAARGGRLVIASRTSRERLVPLWRHPAVRDIGALEPAEIESRLRAEGVNVLLVVQSFDPAEGLIQFNFPSKLTEYMAFGLPVLVLAPPYASVPLWLADEPNAALLVTRPEPDAFAEPLARLADAEERLALAEATAAVGRRYSPERLAKVFEAGLLNAMAASVPQ